MRRTSSSASIDTSAAISGASVSAAVSSSHDNPHALLPSNGSTAANNNDNTKASSSYVQYLLSYEGMVAGQDLEFEATAGHLKRIFERIQTLGTIGKKKSKKTSGGIDDGNPPPKGMLTYLQMRRCLLRMGIGWHHSSFPAAQDPAFEYDDDEISVLSFNSTSSRRSGSSGGSRSRSDIISTDSQLLMLLTKLVEMEEQHRASRTTTGGGDGSKELKYQLDQGLFLPEFVQAYTLLVGGMHAFKSIPDPNDPALSVLCHRVKERTLGMLRPFGPTASNTHNNTDSSCQASKQNYAGLLINTQPSPRGKKKSGSFSKGQTKHIMASKDNVLTKIMEEHDLEMDALTSNIEELRQEVQRKRMALGQRRQRLKLLGLLLSAILVLGCLVAEIRGRDSISDGIESARNDEGMADRNRIAQLKAQQEGLEQKLGVIEGKIRYQVNRNNEIEATSQSVKNQISDINRKELAEKAEIEQCMASHLELTEGLKRETLKRVGVDEELVWCETRLQSQERELNGLAHVSVGSQITASERGVVANSIVKGDVAPKGHRPVYLEMKYNKSIRDSIFLRQAYSAVAGVAVGALLQGLVPTILKLVAPKATIAVLAALPPPVVPKRGMEMVLVDGIFGSSIGFLLIQAIVTFLRPL